LEGNVRRHRSARRRASPVFRIKARDNQLVVSCFFVKSRTDEVSLAVLLVYLSGGERSRTYSCIRADLMHSTFSYLSLHGIGSGSDYE
jgi:hypothetical protein